MPPKKYFAANAQKPAIRPGIIAALTLLGSAGERHYNFISPDAKAASFDRT
jgi:hypothetical protein